MNTEWAKSKIEAVKNRRDWTALPASFEADQVKFLFALIKPHFSKKEIKARIAASRASTFDELLSAIGA
jgi:hypothetical protein